MNLNELRKLPHWSYSAISTYLNCSLQYRFRYVDRAESERSSACFAFGKAFHAAMSYYAMHLDNVFFDVFRDVFKLEVEATPNLVFKPSDDFDSMLDTGMKMLATARENWLDTDHVSGVAVPFKVEVPGLSRPLIGEYDLLLNDGGSTVIVDWKTAAAKWPVGKAGHDLQASAFCYAYAKEHGENPLFRFDVVTKTKNPSFASHWTTRTGEDFRRFELLAKRVDEAVNKGVFLPCETSFSCAACPYADKCRNWR